MKSYLSLLKVLLLDKKAELPHGQSAKAK